MIRVLRFVLFITSTLVAFLSSPSTLCNSSVRDTFTGSTKISCEALRLCKSFGQDKDFRVVVKSVVELSGCHTICRPYRSKTHKNQLCFRFLFLNNLHRPYSCDTVTLGQDKDLRQHLLLSSMATTQTTSLAAKHLVQPVLADLSNQSE